MRRRASAFAILAFVVIMGSPAPALAVSSDDPHVVAGDVTPQRFPDWVCRIVPRLCA